MLGLMILGFRNWVGWDSTGIDGEVSLLGENMQLKCGGGRKQKWRGDQGKSREKIGKYNTLKGSSGKNESNRGRYIVGVDDEGMNASGCGEQQKLWA